MGKLLKVAELKRMKWVNRIKFQKNQDETT